MVVFPGHRARLNHPGFDCNMYYPEVQSGICSFVEIKVASTTKMVSTNVFSFFKLSLKGGSPDLVSTPATYTGRQEDTDRRVEHAEEVTFWPPCARQGGGVGDGESAITFFGQVRERSFSRRFYANRYKQREHW